MAKTKYPIPDLPDWFPEEEHLRDGTMRDEILVMAVEALNKQGFPDLDQDTMWSRPEHRDVVIELLGDCRPLPIVKELIAELKSGQPA